MQSLNSRIVASNVLTELCFFNGCVESIYTEVGRGGANEKQTVKSSSPYFIDQEVCLVSFRN